MINNSNQWPCSWVDQAGPEDYIVVSSRVRLARNLVNFPFPTLLTEDESQQIIEAIGAAEPVNSQLKMVLMSEQNALLKQVLVEKHLISPQFAANTRHETALLTDYLGIVSIMVNEEDHLRLQAILPGLRLHESYAAVKRVDQLIADHVNYAYDAELGYLTACPTNLGTGMRASVMLHLPALLHTGSLEQILNGVAKLGLVARGIYGENSGAEGAMYQISNQVTLGRTEEEIIAGLDSVIAQIVEQEKQARAYFVKHFRLDVEDRIGRAWGVLAGARKMATAEAMKLLSTLRLGAEQQLIIDLKPAVLNELILKIQPASLQAHFGEELDVHERDIKRAIFLRNRLKDIGGVTHDK